MRLIENNKTNLLLLVIFLFSGFTLFYNLNNRLLWGDEAETALLGLSTSINGVPKASYGSNYITLLGAGQDTNENDIWTWSPWLSNYLGAGSFILLGKTTAAARLPFAIIAFLSVLFFSFLTYKLYRNDELTVIATLLYVTNIAFILHARQCRYYALIFFTQVWLIYAYYSLLRGRSKSGILGVAGALVIQFYGNYIFVLPNIIAVVLSALLVHKKYPHLIRNIFISFTAFMFCALPWLFYTKPWSQVGYVGYTDYGAQLIYYLSQIDLYIFPFIMLILPVGVYFVKKNIAARTGSKEETENLITSDIAVFLWILIPVTLLVISASLGMFFRYLLPLIPVFILLLSATIVQYVKIYSLRILLLVALSFSNIVPLLSFSCLSETSIGSPIVRCIGSITTKYENTLSDVVDFFKANAGSKESVLVADPEFPLIFYTNMHVMNMLIHTLSDFPNYPDWILTESASGITVRQIVLSDELKIYYEPIILKVHDTMRGDSRPDPGLYVPYSTQKYKDLKIYKKKRL